MLKLYENIKKIRLAKNMSQSTLAHLVGYNDRSSIAHIESGSVDLPQSKIIQIANALSVSPGALMGYDGLPYDVLPTANKVFVADDIRLEYGADNQPIFSPSSRNGDEYIYYSFPPNSSISTLGTDFVHAIRINHFSNDSDLRQGDIAIFIKDQNLVSFDQGVLVVAIIGNSRATCYRYFKYSQDTFTLKCIDPAIGDNCFYEKDKCTIPVHILGNVIEVRRSLI